MRQFDVQTEKKTELLNITEQVREAVRGNGEGGSAALVYVPHTTAAVTITPRPTPPIVGPGSPPEHRATVSAVALT